MACPCPAAAGLPMPVTASKASGQAWLQALPGALRPDWTVTHGEQAAASAAPAAPALLSAPAGLAGVAGTGVPPSAPQRSGTLAP